MYNCCDTHYTNENCNFTLRKLQLKQDISSTHNTKVKSSPELFLMSGSGGMSLTNNKFDLWYHNMFVSCTAVDVCREKGENFELVYIIIYNRINS